MQGTWECRTCKRWGFITSSLLFRGVPVIGLVVILSGVPFRLESLMRTIHSWHSDAFEIFFPDAPKCPQPDIVLEFTAPVAYR